MTTSAAILPNTGPSTGPSTGLAPWGLFAALLAAAGLPIYLHAPKVYAETYGIGLGALGAVLFALRLVDLVQDPALGWLSARLSARARSLAVAGAVTMMVAAMLGLFAVTPPIAPLWWFALMLTALFTAWSFLSITFYGAGVARAGSLGPTGHLRLAGWREGGALLGLCLAALAPTVLAPLTASPSAGFALGFAVLGLVAVLAMGAQWRAAPVRGPGLRAVLADAPARWLLTLAVVNSAPLAVSSTLFLFFVESRLAAPGWEGPLLILFFLAAAGAAPIWARIAARIGERRALLAGMVLSIAAFAWALTLGPGDTAAFAAICLATGAALGADMVILPAIFARRLATIAPGGAEGFGLWAFASKATLALAAVALLPLLERAGFTPGAATQPAVALTLLGLLYAGAPLILKTLAAALLLAAPLPRE